MNLKVNFFGLTLKNPFFAASGTVGYGEIYFDENPYGAIVTKGISLEPMEGNPPPRLMEVEGGIINSIGLQNVGLENFLLEKVPAIENRGIPYIVNILGTTVKEFAELYSALSQTKAIAIEFNISCPNVKKGGAAFSRDKVALRELSDTIKEIKSKPVLVKLPPILSDDLLEETIAIFQESADAFTISNTYPSLSFDWERGVFFKGGLSGPSIRPITLMMVKKAHSLTDKPIIGVGGIVDGRSALEYFFAGAKFVQIGSINLLDPFCIRDILEDVTDILKKLGFSHIWEAVGIEGMDH